MSFIIREATAADADAMNALLPLLASFDVPAGRNPDDLWMGDRAILESWLEDEAPDTFTLVGSRRIWRSCWIGHRDHARRNAQPRTSSHLEVLAVSDKVHRQGLGQRLIQASEEQAKARWCGQHVTACVWQQHQCTGHCIAKQVFDEEIIRCYKTF